MAAVGGIFHEREDAQQVANGLVLAGVESGSIEFTVLPLSLIDVLGPLGVQPEAILEYERNVRPGDILMTVNTSARPATAVANIIAEGGGLVVQFGRASSGHPGIR